MLPPFQLTTWKHALCQADWYRQLEYELTSFIFPTVHDDPLLKAWRNQAYNLVGTMLERSEIPLAQTGPDLDQERQPLDTIVLHHTEEDPCISLATLNAIGLLRQYALQYLEGNVLGHEVIDQAIWSNHFRQGSMVFFAYHWLIRPDGSCERLLEDRAIGWHAGNWQINTRSVGIALSGNYEHSVPPPAQIAATARLIQRHYPFITHSHLLGHCEVNEQATCPGDHFLSSWKQHLLSQL